MSGMTAVLNITAVVILNIIKEIRVLEICYASVKNINNKIS